MSESKVKGLTPAQLIPINEHRIRGPVRAAGETFWSKAQIVAGVLIGIGATTLGCCAVYVLAVGGMQ